MSIINPKTIPCQQEWASLTHLQLHLGLTGRDLTEVTLLPPGPGPPPLHSPANKVVGGFHSIALQQVPYHPGAWCRYLSIGGNRCLLQSTTWSAQHMLHRTHQPRTPNPPAPCPPACYLCPKRPSYTKAPGPGPDPGPLLVLRCSTCTCCTAPALHCTVPLCTAPSSPRSPHSPHSHLSDQQSRRPLAFLSSFPSDTHPFSHLLPTFISRIVLSSSLSRFLLIPPAVVVAESLNVPALTLIFRSAQLGGPALFRFPPGLTTVSRHRTDTPADPSVAPSLVLHTQCISTCLPACRALRSGLCSAGTRGLTPGKSPSL